MPAAQPFLAVNTIGLVLMRLDSSDAPAVLDYLLTTGLLTTGEAQAGEILLYTLAKAFDTADDKLLIRALRELRTRDRGYHFGQVLISVLDARSAAARLERLIVRNPDLSTLAALDPLRNTLAHALSSPVHQDQAP